MCQSVSSLWKEKLWRKKSFFNCFNREKKTFFAKCCSWDLANGLGSLPGSRKAGEWVNRQKLKVSSAMFLLKGRIIKLNWCINYSLKCSTPIWISLWSPLLLLFFFPASNRDFHLLNLGSSLHLPLAEYIGALYTYQLSVIFLHGNAQLFLDTGHMQLVWSWAEFHNLLVFGGGLAWRVLLFFPRCVRCLAVLSCHTLQREGGTCCALCNRPQLFADGKNLCFSPSYLRIFDSVLLL